MESTDFDDEEDPGPTRTNVAALKILADWVAQHGGVDPSTGAMFDREFVVVDGPTHPPAIARITTPFTQPR